jgi:hypothetical protein
MHKSIVGEYDLGKRSPSYEGGFGGLAAEWGFRGLAKANEVLTLFAWYVW